jgi:mRNA-degrading endonuclease YafQ of YafQ-DinJ toxin-antitoxin module
MSERQTIKRLQASKTFTRNLENLSSQVRKKVRKQLNLLLQDFRYPSLHTEKVQGATFAGEDVWSIRVDRDHRILFTIRKEEKAYFLVAVGTHDVYRRF